MADIIQFPTERVRLERDVALFIEKLVTQGMSRDAAEWISKRMHRHLDAISKAEYQLQVNDWRNEDEIRRQMRDLVRQAQMTVLEELMTNIVDLYFAQHPSN